METFYHNRTAPVKVFLARQRILGKCTGKRDIFPSSLVPFAFIFRQGALFLNFFREKATFFKKRFEIV